MPATPTNERGVCRDMPDKSPARPDVRLARAAADQWGVLSLDELFACGLSRGAVADRARNGRLHPIHRGVYAVGHPSIPLEGRFLAAVKACGPTAILSHFAAAAVWGFMPWDDRYPEVTVVGAWARSHPGLRIHRTTTLDRRDILRRHGIPATSPGRTLLDLAATLDHRPLRGATRRAQSLHRVNLRQLADVLARHPRRRGSARLARIIATGPAPTRSELEDVVLDLILRGGHVHPDVNVALRLSGRRVVPDFRWPAERLVVEADGAAWHDNPLAREDDAERQALLEAHGERVLRVTWEQAIARPTRTLARLRAAGAPYTERPMISTNQLKNVRANTSPTRACDGGTTALTRSSRRV
jgi:very-short-patch-repair endonuclease